MSRLPHYTFCDAQGDNIVQHFDWQCTDGMVNNSSYDTIHHRLAWRELYDTYHTPLQETQYEYDGVGNIVCTRQYAPAYGGLGGEYALVYGYDEQNRLLDARQYNSETGDYSYFMSYSPSGLVSTKVSPELNADMVFGYRYDGEYISHQPKIISSVSDDEDVTLLGWNTNGQMTSMVQPNQDRFRKHLWDETGQLALSVSDEYCGYYAYDARGERAYKLTGVVFTDQYDAGTIQATASFDDAVLYVNPYMVVTPRGYTKHYYNGSQRIASRIGGYWHDESVFVSSPALTNAAESLWAATLHTEELQEQETPFDEVYISPVGTILPVPQYGPVVANLSGMHADDLLSPVFSGHNSERTSDDTVGIYFYHSDHLGSANWITNSQGEAVQYLHYMPYGELWENQQFSEYDERFKFTGKERDTETGYDYFGARYYLSLLGIWMSPDLLLDEYPEISPYAYCRWNPLRYVDPNGEEWEDETAKNTAYKFREAMLQLKNDYQQQIDAIDREIGNTEISANRKTELEGLRKDLLIAQRRLSDGISAISALEKDANHKYGFTNTPSLGEASTVFMSDNGTIKIDAPSSALGMHEVLHVYQGLLQENLVFKKGYLVNAGKTQIQMLKNERDSYQLQYSIDKLSLPSYFQQPSIRGIAIPLIDAFVDKNGNRPYHYK